MSRGGGFEGKKLELLTSFQPQYEYARANKQYKDLWPSIFNTFLAQFPLIGELFPGKSLADLEPHQSEEYTEALVKLKAKVKEWFRWRNNPQSRNSNKTISGKDLKKIYGVKSTREPKDYEVFAELFPEVVKPAVEKSCMDQGVTGRKKLPVWHTIVSELWANATEEQRLAVRAKSGKTSNEIDVSEKIGDESSKSTPETYQYFQNVLPGLLQAAIDPAVRKAGVMAVVTIVGPVPKLGAEDVCASRSLPTVGESDDDEEEEGKGSSAQDHKQATEEGANDAELHVPVKPPPEQEQPVSNQDNSKSAIPPPPSQPPTPPPPFTSQLSSTNIPQPPKKPFTMAEILPIPGATAVDEAITPPTVATGFTPSKTAPPFGLEHHTSSPNNHLRTQALASNQPPNRDVSSQNEQISGSPMYLRLPSPSPWPSDSQSLLNQWQPAPYSMSDLLNDDTPWADIKIMQRAGMGDNKDIGHQSSTWDFGWMLQPNQGENGASQVPIQNMLNTQSSGHLGGAKGSTFSPFKDASAITSSLPNFIQTLTPPTVPHTAPQPTIPQTLMPPVVAQTSTTPVAAQTSTPPVPQTFTPPVIPQASPQPVVPKTPTPPANPPWTPPVLQLPTPPVGPQLPTPPIILQEPIPPLVPQQPIVPVAFKTPIPPVVPQTPILPVVPQTPIPPVVPQTPAPPPPSSVASYATVPSPQPTDPPPPPLPVNPSPKPLSAGSSANAARRSSRGWVPSKRAENLNRIRTNVPIHAPSVAISQEEVGPPEWFITAETYMKANTTLGDRWMNLVGKWVELETAMGYGRIAKGALPVQFRPDEWKDWTSKSNRNGHVGRAYDSPPFILEPAEFGLALTKWWSAVQPSFRKSESVFPKQVWAEELGSGDAWTSIRKSGPNGLVSVVTMMRWWGTEAMNLTNGFKTDSREEWKYMVSDITLTIIEMLKHLPRASSKRKREAGDVGGKENHCLTE